MRNFFAKFLAKFMNFSIDIDICGCCMSDSQVVVHTLAVGYDSLIKQLFDEILISIIYVQLRDSIILLFQTSSEAYQYRH